MYYHSFFKMVVENNIWGEGSYKRTVGGTNYSPIAALAHNSVMEFITFILYNKVSILFPLS